MQSNSTPKRIHIGCGVEAVQLAPGVVQISVDPRHIIKAAVRVVATRRRTGTGEGREELALAIAGLEDALKAAGVGR